MLWKVLIVDDELIVRNHLRSLVPWEHYGFMLCGEASDGEAAVERIESLCPDVVFIDVSMPRMDGIQLSRYMSEHHRNVKTVMLSSYDSYDYVRDSLKNGAVDYLLKHRINPEILATALEKLKEQLEKENSLRKREEDSLRNWKMVSPVVAQGYLKNLLLRKVPDVEGTRMNYPNMVFAANKPSWVVAAMQIANFEIITTRFNETELNLYYGSIVDLCQQAIGDYRIGCAAYLERGRFAMLLAFEDLRSEHMIRQQLETLIRRLEMTLRNLMNVHALCAYSAPFHHLGQIAENYHALIRHLVEDSGGGLRSGGEAGESALGKGMSISIKDEKKLLAAIDISDKDEVGRLLQDIFKRIAPAGYAVQQRVLSELVHIAGKIGTKAGLEMSWMQAGLSSLSESGNRLELAAGIIVRIYEALTDELHQASKMKYCLYVRQAMEQVQSLYHKPVSLEGIAELIGITPSYLSRLFKEETGTTFTEYLNEYRIEISKRLIENGKHKIKEIYTLVGFNNQSYFIKLFKETVGETPLVFAKKKGIAKE